MFGKLEFKFMLLFSLTGLLWLVSFKEPADLVSFGLRFWLASFSMRLCLMLTARRPSSVNILTYCCMYLELNFYKVN